MKHENRRSKIRKQFLIPFFIVNGVCISFVVFMKADSEIKTFICLVILGLYLSGFMFGYISGRESIREVLDHVEPGLKWKIRNTEVGMIEKEYD